MSSRPTIPTKARDEIMSLLAADMRIGADQLIGILEKHHVSGNVNTLQRGYRRRIAQRIMAGIRDDNGKREILAVRSENGGTEYVVVDGCTDPKKLRAMQHRLQSNLAGLENTSDKVRRRLRFVERFSRLIRGKKGKRI